MKITIAYFGILDKNFIQIFSSLKKPKNYLLIYLFERKKNPFLV